MWLTILRGIGGIFGKGLLVRLFGGVAIGAMLATGVWYVQKTGQHIEQVETLLEQLEVCNAQLGKVHSRPDTPSELDWLLRNEEF